MRVRRQELNEVLIRLSTPGFYSLDTETTGLHAYLGDRLFSIIIADKDVSYYFNFEPYGGLHSDWVLPRTELFSFQKILGIPSSTWFMHNAKFDLSMLAAEGLSVHGTIHDTEVMARLVRNDHMSYSLASCAERIGLKKSDAVDDYIAEHKLFTWKETPGKKKRVKVPHFQKVPYDIIAPYGEQDARITFALGMYQRQMITEKSNSTPGIEGQLLHTYANECELTKTCFRMEQVGIQIDRNYCERAFQYEMDRVSQAALEFQEISGESFIDSAKVFARVFDSLGLMYGKTDKGNPSFKDEELEKINHSIVDVIRKHRGSSKKANTYYRNFLDLSDTGDVLHANIRQGGTDTGRFSYSEPNLQNLSRPEEDGEYQEFEIRRAFIPRPDYCFVMIDYDQMEYRMMLNYAKEMKLIEKVLGGLDVHQATANQMGVSRTQAKTLNFMLLYGGGVLKLAKSLKITELEAKVAREKYFEALPAVKNFMWNLTETVKRRGYLRNWAGFHCYFDDPNFAYKAPNYLIQGGCAQVMKFSLVAIDNLLKDKRSRLLVSVHDEAVLEIHRNEFDIIPAIVKIMENAFQPAHGKVLLPLTCGVSYSWKSWAEKIKGYPDATKGSTCENDR